MPNIGYVRRSSSSSSSKQLKKVQGYNLYKNRNMQARFALCVHEKNSQNPLSTIR